LWSQAREGGNLPAVTPDQLIRLKLERYYTADGKEHVADFEWRFTPDEFVLKRGAAAIPVDLRKKLFFHDPVPDEIRGKWTLKNGGGELVLTEIKAGLQSGVDKVTLSIQQTGIGVIRVGDPEYVFGL